MDLAGGGDSNMNYRSIVVWLAATACAPGCVIAESEGGAGDSTAGDNASAAMCSVADAELFRWDWSFGAYVPGTEEDASGLTSPDALPPLQCGVSGFAEDSDDDTLLLVLDCTVEGEPVPEQALDVTPIPEAVLGDLSEGEALSVQFRPHWSCPNGCSADRGGWLSIRRAEDDALLLGLVSAPRLVEPVEEVTPLTISVADDTPCAPIYDELPCEQGGPGWIQTQQLRIELSDEEESVVGAGMVQLSEFDVVINTATEGAPDSCTQDAGERGYVSLMVTRRP